MDRSKQSLPRFPFDHPSLRLVCWISTKFSFVGLVIVLGVGALPTVRAESQGPTASIGELIRQLDSDSYDARKRATNELIRAGADVSLPLVEAIQVGSREVMLRAIHVMNQQARSSDPHVEKAARAALQRTVQIGSRPAVIRAQSALTSVDRWRQSNAMVELRKLGAETADHMMVDRTFFPSVRNHELTLGDRWRGQPADLMNLRWLADLRRIYVMGKRLGDEEMTYIARAPNLESIVFIRSSITEKGLSRLATIPRLNSIELQYCALSEKGISEITKVENLYKVSLKGTDISNESAAKISARVGADNFHFHRGALLGVEADATALAANGCPIRDVTPGSAAEASGLQGGDIITAINEAKVDSFDTLRTLMARHRSGEKIAITYRRGLEVNTTTAQLGEWNIPHPRRVEPPVERIVPRKALPQQRVLPPIRQIPRSGPAPP